MLFLLLFAGSAALHLQKLYEIFFFKHWAQFLFACARQSPFFMDILWNFFLRKQISSVFIGPTATCNPKTHLSHLYVWNNQTTQVGERRACQKSHVEKPESVILHKKRKKVQKLQPDSNKREGRPETWSESNDLSSLRSLFSNTILSKVDVNRRCVGRISLLFILI